MNRDWKIGFIGFGRMGEAIWQGIRGDFLCFAYDIHPKQSSGIEFRPSLAELVDCTDVILLAVKPGQVPEVLRQIHRPIKLISIAAGISMNTMKTLLPEGSLVVRSMPNLPLMVGEGCLGYYGNRELYPYVQQIFSKLGLLIEVSSEDLLDAVTGLSGSGPAFVFSFLHSLAEGGVKCGLNYKESLDLAFQTVLGSLRYFQNEKSQNPDLHPIELRNRVTSPGGTTIYGLSEWERHSVSSGIIESVFQAYLRSRELGKEKPIQ